MNAVAESGLPWVAVYNRSALAPIARVLSSTVGVVSLPEEVLAKLAIVQFKDGTVAAITCGDVDSEETHWALWVAKKARLDGRPVEVSKYYEVPESTLLALYDGGSEQTVITATSRDEADTEIDLWLTRAVEEESNDIHFLGSPATTEIRIHTGATYVRLGEISSTKFQQLAKAMYVRCGEKTRTDDFTIDQPLRGQFVREIKGTRYAIRLQTQGAHPDTFDMTLRLLELGAQSLGKDFAKLGFAPHQGVALRRMLDEPRGMIVVCGPTGSGKSTTLKSALEYLDRRHDHEVKIQTLEDPVEYEIAGARQASVTKSLEGESEEQMWTRALTSLMRMRPDVIMLGEVRNPPTARTAEQAARTGHKLLTTIHADRVFSVYRRFVENGVKLDALAEDGFMNGIVRQRLLPILCPECSIPYAKADRSALEPRVHQALFNAAAGEGALELVRVRGHDPQCARCHGRGSVGLTVCAEMLLPDAEINDALARGDYRTAERQWRNGNAGHVKGTRFHSMLEHALVKCFSGEVSPRAIDRQVDVLEPELVPKIGRDVLGSVLA